MYFKKENRYMRVEPVSPELLDNVKRFIVASEDIDTFGKQAVLHLIDKTNGLSRACSLKANDVDLGRIMSDGVHHMGSANGTTHLGYFLDAMGIPGSFHSRTDSGPRWVIWFTPNGKYNNDGRVLTWDPEKIKKVNLTPYLPTRQVVVEGSFLTPSSLAALQGANLIALTVVNNLTFGLDCPVKAGFRLYQYCPISRWRHRYPMLIETINGAKLFMDIIVRNIKGTWTPISADLTYRPYAHASNRLDGAVETQVKLAMSRDLRIISCKVKAKGLPNPRKRKSV